MLLYIETKSGSNYAHKSEIIRTWRYSEYMIELRKYTRYYETGRKSEDYAIFMNLYEDWGLSIKHLKECHCLNICYDTMTAWEFIKQLELDRTQSII